jgi:hypothetical protein
VSWRAPGREARQVALLWGAAALSTAVLVPLLVAFSPFYPRCPFHVLTGLPCPSCGATRAGLALLRGRPLEALAFNPLATLAEVVFLAGGVLAPVWLWAGGKVPVLPRALPLWARVAAVAVILANWAWLIANGV